MTTWDFITTNTTTDEQPATIRRYASGANVQDLNKDIEKFENEGFLVIGGITVLRLEATIGSQPHHWTVLAVEMAKPVDDTDDTDDTDVD